MSSLEVAFDKVANARKPRFAICSAHAGVDATQIEVLHQIDTAKFHQPLI